MVSFPEIKTVIINNLKYFIKSRYEPGDVVWWVDNMKITGRVLNVQGYYCHIMDEYGNEYYKSHLEIYLEEANIIQLVLNENCMIKKELYNLTQFIRQLQKEVIKNYENTAFNIEPFRSSL
jgi:hypothetical protein